MTLTEFLGECFCRVPIVDNDSFSSTWTEVDVDEQERIAILALTVCFLVFRLLVLVLLLRRLVDRGHVLFTLVRLVVLLR